MAFKFSDRVERLFAQLTPAEKVSLLAGKSQWRTAAIPRLGIPDIKVSDGPSGARGETYGEGVPAAFLPSGVSMGATWDEELLREMGELIAQEVKTKSASVILSPTMCIHRHPLGGRNFESYSEDPFLTGRLATAFVQGVQSQGVGTTPKHFVANDQETHRYKMNVAIAPRALREIYLRPFQMVVREADPWCMMTAYNKVNGHHVDMSKELLTDIVRNEWDWQGVFVSDWGGTNSCVDSINAGLDLEMPGPPLRRAPAAMAESIQDGAIDLNQVDLAAKRVLRLLERAGRFEDAPDEPERSQDTPEKREKLRRAAASGIVMLKNENRALPLRPSENIKRLAIVGPNAERVVAGGGGSAYIKGQYWTSVLGSMKSKLESTQTEVVFSAGAKVNRFLPTMPGDQARNPRTGLPGACIDWYHGHEAWGQGFTRTPVTSTDIDDLYYISFNDAPPMFDPDSSFSFLQQVILTPKTTGTHHLSLASIGPSRMYIDGELAAQKSGAFEEKGSLFFTYGSNETVFTWPMEAGRVYHLRIEYHTHDRQTTPGLKDLMEPMENTFQGTRLGYEEVEETDLPAQAAELAQSSDAAIVVVGRDREWETEGEDIPEFSLPGQQNELIEKVAAACKRVIVVVQAGTPVDLQPWADKVDAILYCWYQGQELGNAAADVICGDFNPSGRLPITFPRRLEDCPAYSSFPGEQHQTFYAEGIYVGYKWWDLLGTEPLYPIGFGLSYSQFRIREPTIDQQSLVHDRVLTVTAQVDNISAADGPPGRETVLIWVSQTSPCRLTRPRKQICGFAKTRPLGGGETCQVEVRVDAYALSVFDPQKSAWVIDQDTEFEFLIGTNAATTTPIGRVKVPKEIRYVHRLGDLDQ